MRSVVHARRAAIALAGGAAMALASGIATGADASSVGACHAGQLSATMTHIFGSEGAGNTGYRLNLKNNGPAPCRLGNHPKLQLIGAAGNALPTHVTDYPSRSGAVTVAAHRTASARLRFSPDIPGPGEPGRGPCEPVAHKVRVTLTAPGSGSTVGPIKPPTSVCEHGAIQEQPLN